MDRDATSVPRRANDQVEWAPIRRTDFDDYWSHMASVTVLAALPGWGRSEWMRQCASAWWARGSGGAVRWIRDRHEAEVCFRAPASPVADLLLVDDVIDAVDDPLWDAISTFAHRNPRARIVVSAIDHPPPQLGAVLATRVFDERHLRFNDHELQEILERFCLHAPIDTRFVLATSMSGCPDLVRRCITRVISRQREQPWATVDPPPDGSVLEYLLDHPRWAGIERSSLMQALIRGRGMRRFTPSMITADQPGTHYMSQQLERLRALPFCETHVDEETGGDLFSWTPPVWEWFTRTVPPEERRRELEASLQSMVDSGRIVGQLPYLLMLHEFAAAERLVDAEFRRFLLFTDVTTTESLVTLAPSLAEHYPRLMLLASELRTQRAGRNPRSVREARVALRVLRRETDTSLIGQLTRSSQVAFAAAAGGDRATAIRFVAHIAELLADEDGVHSAVADRTPGTGQRLSGQFYLAYSAALQVDRHEEALEIARVMHRLGDRLDRVAQIDRIGLYTQQDLAGLRSLWGTVRSAEPSYAAAWVLLEEGEDERAMAALAPASAHMGPAITRSALDATLLLAQTLSGAPLHIFDVGSVVDLSRNAWTPRTPSTFVGFAGVVAYGSLGEWARAVALSDELTRGDWFSHAAAALVALNDGQHDAALVHVEHAEKTSLPRLATISRTIGVAAQIGTGYEDAAIERLKLAWSLIPSPRLLRFGMRFVDPPTAATILSWTPFLPGDLADALEACRPDHRPLRMYRDPRLSPTEREIVALLRHGLSNAQIAERRFVSINTLRTQIKRMYRKLGVSGRAEALTVLEQRNALHN